MEQTKSEQMFLEAPAPVTFGAGEVVEERPARLLEAGDYPDKGLRVTEADLDGIVARFPGAGVPVKVEHVDSPLDPLGQVRRVWREGGALLGTLVFPADLAGFLRRRGAARLSVGLTREPLTLSEVSLVLKPRVAAATLMREEAPEHLTPQPPSLLRKGEQDLRDREIVRLRAELSARAVDVQIAGLKAQGRLVPALEGLARALLSVPGSALVTLSEGDMPVADVFLRYLRAQPAVVTFGETVPAGATPDDDGFTQYEHMFLSERLGVDPAKVAALLREQAEQKGKNDAS